jgi:hypothetical protein
VFIFKKGIQRIRILNKNLLYVTVSRDFNPTGEGVIMHPQIAIALTNMQ